MTREARYWLDLAGASLPLRELHGREAVSTPFRLEARFVVPPGGAFEPEAFLKAEAVIRIDREGDVVGRSISGVVTDLAVGATARGAPAVRVVVEPRLALARHRSDVRIFRDRTAPEIVVEVLAAIGVAPELRLRDTYASRPYCVQLRETDLDFVSRLLEDEGIFYFFTDAGGLVLGDSPAAYDVMAGDPALLFRAGSGLDRNDEVVVDVGRRARIAAGQVTLRDWTPDHPSLDMDVRAPGPTPGGPELYDFPGEYDDPADGARKAKRLAESLACASAAVVGRSFCARLAPGHKLRLSETPSAVADGELVVTAVEHAFRLDGSGFSNRFEALGARVAFRPAHVTPVPELVNPITGFVTGPPGADVHTDESGRVKVHFPWDRKFPLDDTCSHWIPVLQDNTGHSVAIPRVGWEVLVHFMEGDPDRPVILGRVYNGSDPFPETLPAGKTRSALKSMSSPGRGGTNVIRFDDAAGSEELYVHAQKDQNVVIAHDRTEEVLSDVMHVVKRDETIAVGHDHTADVHEDVRTVVDGNQTWTVAGNRTRKVLGSNEATVTKDHTLTIGGSHHRRIGTDDVVNTKDLDEKIGAVSLEASVKTNGTQAGKAMTLTVGGAFIEIAKDGKGESAKARVETVGGLFFTKAASIAHTAKKTRVTTVGGALVVKAAKTLAVKAGTTATIAATSATWTGAKKITLKVGGSSVVLDKNGIGVVASSEIHVKVTSANDQVADVSSQI